MRAGLVSLARGWQELLITHPMVVILAVTALVICIDHLEILPPKAQCLLIICAGCQLLTYRLSLIPLVRILWATLIIAAIALGHHHQHWFIYDSSDIGWQATTTGKTVELICELINEPQIKSPPGTPSPLQFQSKEPSTRLRLRILASREDSTNESQPFTATIGSIEGVVRGLWSNGIAGDRVLIRGKLRSIDGQRNPGQFDFQDFYRSKRQRAVLFIEAPAAIQVLDRSSYSPATIRAALRIHFDRMLSKYLPPADAAIASAMLLGKRHRLDPLQQSRFIETGTAHLLAISGLHVGILASAGFWLLRLGWLPRHWSLVLVVVQVTFFAWLVEFNPPVTRAALLINLFCLSRMLGQRGLSFNVLALAGLIVLAMNPADLFNTGPQLSFLAVTALIAIARAAPHPQQIEPAKRLWINSRGKAWRHVHRVIQGFNRTCRSSAALWLVTSPLIALRFHLVSWGGLVANPIVIPLMSGVLYGGLAVMLVGDVCPFFTRGAADICQTSLWLMDTVLFWIQQFWWSSQWVIGPPAWSVAIFLFGFWSLLVCPQIYWDFQTILGWLLAKILYGKKRLNTDKTAIQFPAPIKRSRITAKQDQTRVPRFVIYAVFIVWWISFWVLPNQWLWWTQRSQRAYSELTFIDVGHGTSVLVRTPGGKLILYDAGSFGSVDTATNAISGVLWSLGIMHLDALIISHADLDHYNAVPNLAERFSIGRIYLTPMNYHQSHAGVVYLRERLAQHCIPISLISAGDHWQIDEVSTAQVLSPPNCGTGGNDNANSIVLLMKLAERTVLLPGDIDGVGLQQLLKTSIVPVDLAMAPHHGSLSSKPAKFVAWCRPTWVAISGDQRRVSKTSISQYSSLGAQVSSTSSSGALRFRLSPDTIVCHGWLSNPN